MRKKKFVVWLSNYTDHRDDEWKYIWAYDYVAAVDIVHNKLVYNKNRFSAGRIYTIQEFHKIHGNM